MEATGFEGKLMLNSDASPDRPLLRLSEEDSATYGGDYLASLTSSLPAVPMLQTISGTWRLFSSCSHSISGAKSANNAPLVPARNVRSLTAWVPFNQPTG